MSRILVLGAGGFIGKRLCETLIKDNFIKGFDRPGCAPSLESSNMEMVYGDYRTYDKFDELIEDVDLIFHLICCSIPKPGTDYIQNEIDNDLLPTIRLLEAIKKAANKPKLIFISSGGTIYGNVPQNQVEIDSPKKPICSYGLIKLVSEQYIQFYGEKDNIDYRIARISNAYGQGQNNSRGQGLIPILIEKIQKDENIVIYGNTIRDYIHLDDIVNGLCAVADYSGEERIFHIASGVGHSTLEVVEAVEKAMNKKCNYSKEPQRKFDVDRIVLDIEKSKKELNWEPKYTLEEGVKTLLS